LDTWDERIVMVADEDFVQWRQDWLAESGRA